MSTLWAIAIVLGVAHSWYVYVVETREFRAALEQHPVKVRARAAYFAAWTLVLWATLGASLLVHWLIAAVLYVITRALPRTTWG